MMPAPCEYFRKIDALGGMVPAIERGFPQREIQEAAFQFQKAVERREKVIVGVNEFVDTDGEELEILKVSEEAERSQRARLVDVRARRNERDVEKRLAALKHAAEVQVRRYVIRLQAQDLPVVPKRLVKRVALNQRFRQQRVRLCHVRRHGQHLAAEALHFVEAPDVLFRTCGQEHISNRRHG